MSRFTITLPSNSSMDYHPNNTASQYTTKLNEVIELDGSWEVGLLEASFPSKVDNVLPYECYYRMYMRDDNYYNVVLPAGRYANPDEIVNALHDAQRRSARMSPDDSVFVFFRKIPRRNLFGMKIRSNAVHITGVRFSAVLARMLGFDSDKTYSGNVEIRPERPMNLTGADANLLYVYCDLLEQVLVGNTKAPLLRIIGKSSDTSSDVEHVAFNPVQYVPLQKKCFDTVTINMMTDTGEPMPFAAGKSIAVLEFRRSAHPYLLL